MRSPDLRVARRLLAAWFERHPNRGPYWQLPVGACPSTRPGEPPVAGTRMGRSTRGHSICPMDRWTKKGREYTGARGYHPLLAIAAGTGDVLMSRLREGRANTARGAAHFLVKRWGGCAARMSPGKGHRGGPERRTARQDDGVLRSRPCDGTQNRWPNGPPSGVWWDGPLPMGNPVHSRHGPAASHSTPRLRAVSMITALIRG